MIITFRLVGDTRTCLAFFAASAIAVNVISTPSSSTGIDSIAATTGAVSCVGSAITGVTF